MIHHMKIGGFSIFQAFQNLENMKKNSIEDEKVNKIVYSFIEYIYMTTQVNSWFLGGGNIIISTMN